MSKEYIDKDELYDAIDGEFDLVFDELPEIKAALLDMIRNFQNLDPADVKPVVRGRWIKAKYADEWRCSCCGAADAYAYCDDINHKPTILQDNFCPNCGADMRKEENDEQKC